jgi:hypothetical protein
MEPGDALSAAAQIAVALAGFAGVVVAFRRGSLHDWPPLDKYRLWLLLANSAVPLIGCLFGMVLLSVRPAPPWIWGWCSAFAILLQVPFLVFNSRNLRRLEPNSVRGTGAYRYVFYGLAIAGTTLILCQVVNVALLNRFWIFFLGIAFQVSAGIVQFIRMILLPPREPGADSR